jgi:hypothetical protein
MWTTVKYLANEGVELSDTYICYVTIFVRWALKTVNSESVTIEITVICLKVIVEQVADRRSWS